MTRNTFAHHTRRNFMRIAGLAALAVAARAQVSLAQTGAAPLKIGMVGSGREGGALGKLFAKAGHPVMFSSRHPENLKDLAASAGPLAQTGTVEQAIAFGDEEGEIISRALGQKHAILLAHHGQLVACSTIEEAAVLAVFMERAAKMQLRARAIGTIKPIRPELAREARQYRLKPKAIEASFNYFARQIRRDQGDDVLK